MAGYGSTKCCSSFILFKNPCFHKYNYHKSIYTKAKLFFSANSSLSLKANLSLHKNQSESQSPGQNNFQNVNHERSHTDDFASSCKRKILDKSLMHVSKYGWSEKSIMEGAVDCGYSSSVHGMFTRGGADLALYFYKTSNKLLLDRLSSQLAHLETQNEESGSQSKSTTKFVRDAVEDRIRMTAVYQDSWPQAMATLAHPNAAADALLLLSQLVDDVWYLAGDKSYDMNWYTKRASLAFIYKTTELFMLQDKSDDFEETWKVLDRRFSDVGVIGATLSTTNDLAQGMLNSGLRSFTTIVKNISGIYPR